MAPRSGLAWKNFINVGAGVIDEDYRGNVGVVLFNHAKADFNVAKGDRIAQLICERIFYPEIEEETGNLSKLPEGNDVWVPRALRNFSFKFFIANYCLSRANSFISICPFTYHNPIANSVFG